MSADKSTQDTDVSGNEAVETAARRGKKNEINKNINVQNYSDKKTNSYMDSKNEKFSEGKKHNLSIFGIKLDPLNKLFDKGSKSTRAYYTDRVLKGTAKEKFSMLSSKDKEKQYKGYLDRRMSGETDAMGNVNINYGRDGNDSVKTVKQVEEESKKEMETPKTTEEEEAAYKKRKGLVGSRSLFSTGGQRGFFN